MAKSKKYKNGVFNYEALVEAVSELTKEKNVSSDEIMELIRSTINRVYRDVVNSYRDPKDNKIKVNQKNADDMLVDVIIKSPRGKKGTVKIIEQKEVVRSDDDVEDDFYQIGLEEAKVYDPKAKIGHRVNINTVDIDSFLDSNPSFMTKFSQILTQKVSDISRTNLLDHYKSQIGTIITGIVEARSESQDGWKINFGNASSILLRRNVSPKDEIDLLIGREIKVYLSGVKDNSKNVVLLINRNSVNFVTSLLKDEVMELASGDIYIVKAARREGFRTKVIVRSSDPNIDAVGSCIGSGSGRTMSVSSQLNGEKIDIIKYSDNKLLQIYEAMKPVEIVGITDFDYENNKICVICNNGDKEHAIGNNGSNVILASELCDKVSIDVLTSDEALTSKVNFRTIDSIKRNYLYSQSLYEDSYKTATTSTSSYQDSYYDEEDEEVTTTTSTSTSTVTTSTPSVEVETTSSNVTSTSQPSTSTESKEDVFNFRKEEPSTPKVEINITTVASKSLEDLEKMIDAEKNKDKQQSQNQSKKKKVETSSSTSTSPVTPTPSTMTTNLPIYSDEELLEDDDDPYYDDEEDDYYSDEDAEYDELYNN